MKRLPVDSSCIASIGYESSECELDIEFRAGIKVYRYFEVPPEEHAAFMAAESKGRYLNEVFKPKGHRYDIVQPGEEADVTSEGELTIRTSTARLIAARLILRAARRKSHL